MNPSSATAYLAHGVSLSLAGRLREGIPQIEKAINLSPQDPWLYQYMTLLALAYISAHDYEMAEKRARKAVLISNEYTEAHFSLALSLGYLGRNEEARAELEACQRLNPDFINKRISVPGLPGAELILDGLRKADWKC